MMKREKLISLINKKLPAANPVPSEEFDGQTGGVWIRGSEAIAHDGLRIFDYYTMCDQMVHPKLEKILEGSGWFWEPLDAGTIFLWKI